MSVTPNCHNSHISTIFFKINFDLSRTPWGDISMSETDKTENNIRKKNQNVSWYLMTGAISS